MSNLYNKASLVMNPQLVDTGKVYSIKPEDRKGDFTFSRSTAATRVNADGNIEKETQNFLLQSNSFDTTWLQTRINLTSGQSGYDGGSNAWQLQSNDASTTYLEQSVAVSGVQTISLYAKVGTADYLAFYASSGARAWFNLNSGSISSSSSNIDTQIENVGNGWYRCSMSYNASTTYVRIYVTDVDGNFTSAIGANIYIQDAQLEQGLVARDVITTTTAAVEGGVTDNVPRLDYTDSSCPALLLEPQRTNLVTSSEYTNGYIGTGSVQEFNAAISPEGVQNAVKIIADTSTFQHNRFTTISTTGAHSFSVFAKAAEYDFAQLYGGGGSGSRFSVVANLTDGSIDTYDGITTDQIDIQDYGNGWYRIIVSNFTLSSTFVAIAPIKQSGLARDAGYDIDYVGDNVSGAYFYGLQCEAGSYATSYIPTYGSSVTRVGETCQVEDKGALINSEQGTLYFEGIAIDPSFANVISFSDGTNTNRICLTLPQNATNINAFSSVGGSKIDNNILHDPSVNSKYAIVWNGNSFKVFVNGVKKVDNTMAGSFSANTLTDIRFDRGDGNLNFGGFCKSYLSIASALTDQQAIDLTTI